MNMVNANITFPDGTKMEVEGTVEDIIAIKNEFNKKNIPKQESNTLVQKKNIGIKASKGPMGRTRILIEEDFFGTKKTITDILKKLEEKGFYYNAQALSPTLVRLVRKGELRRIKEEGQWRYVNA